MARPKETLVHSQHLHARAEECRSLADMFQNEETRKRMLKVAADYDEMAAAAEQREAAELGGPSAPVARDRPVVPS